MSRPVYDHTYGIWSALIGPKCVVFLYLDHNDRVWFILNRGPGTNEIERRLTTDREPHCLIEAAIWLTHRYKLRIEDARPIDDNDRRSEGEVCMPGEYR